VIKPQPQQITTYKTVTVRQWRLQSAAGEGEPMSLGNYAFAR